MVVGSGLGATSQMNDGNARESCPRTSAAAAASGETAFGRACCCEACCCRSEEEPPTRRAAVTLPEPAVRRDAL